jgi:hypothetical protein
MSHLLIRHSFRFEPKSEDLGASGWTYARDIGMWRKADGADGDKPKPVSKKADQETGEDMKGE